MTSFRLLFVCVVPLLLACGNSTENTTGSTTSITLKNPLDKPRKDILLHISPKSLGEKALWMKLPY